MSFVWFRPAIRLLLIGMLSGSQLLALSAPLVQGDSALTLGQVVTRELQGGATQQFSLAARAGQLLRVSVEAQGSDLICTLTDPNGQQQIGREHVCTPV